MSASVASRLAWTLWVLSVSLAALGLFLLFLNGTLANVIEESVGVDVLVAVVFPAVGATVASRRPDNAVG